MRVWWSKESFINLDHKFGQKFRAKLGQLLKLKQAAGDNSKVDLDILALLPVMEICAHLQLVSW